MFTLSGTHHTPFESVYRLSLRMVIFSFLAVLSLFMHISAVSLPVFFCLYVCVRACAFARNYRIEKKMYGVERECVGVLIYLRDR